MSAASPNEQEAAERAAGERLVGRTIAGKFAIEAVLGSGAMGVLYRAKQIALDKVVAIKVMHARLVSDKAYAARFHLEAKAASRLDHPNSIRILDFGQEPDGLLYIAMDYLGGRDLLDIINEQWPLSTSRIVDILSQALSALAVAHEMGVLHRDLKPENIMVLRGTNDDGTPADRVKVCDFGIAKIDDAKDAQGHGAKLSTGGAVVGTPAYMSPEQARGDPLDARTDIFSVGVILYQMLTGRVPFDAPTPLSTMYKLVNEEAPLPSSLRSGIDAGLEAVCVKAMAKKPEQRYQNARQMRAALRAVVGLDARTSGQTETLALPPIPVQTAFPKRSVPLLAFTGVAALIAAAGAFWLAAKSRHAPVESTALVVAQPPDPTPAQSRSASPDLVPLPTPVDPVAAAKPKRTKAADVEASPEPVAKNARPTAPVPSPVAKTPVPTTTITQPPPAPPAPPPAPSPVVIEPPRAPDPASMFVEIAPATATIGTTVTSVGKALSPLASKLTACYRSAPSQVTLGSAPATLHVETDENGVITDAKLDPRVGPAVRACIVGAVRGRKISNVDTGSASADVPLWFKSR